MHGNQLGQTTVAPDRRTATDPVGFDRVPCAHRTVSDWTFLIDPIDAGFGMHSRRGRAVGLAHLRVLMMCLEEFAVVPFARANRKDLLNLASFYRLP
jgi:hypothetical protein